MAKNGEHPPKNGKAEKKPPKFEFQKRKETEKLARDLPSEVIESYFPEHFEKLKSFAAQEGIELTSSVLDQFRAEAIRQHLAIQDGGTKLPGSYTTLNKMLIKYLKVPTSELPEPPGNGNGHEKYDSSRFEKQMMTLFRGTVSDEVQDEADQLEKRLIASGISAEEMNAHMERYVESWRQKIAAQPPETPPSAAPEQPVAADAELPIVPPTAPSRSEQSSEDDTEMSNQEFVNKMNEPLGGAIQVERKTYGDSVSQVEPLGTGRTRTESSPLSNEPAVQVQTHSTGPTNPDVDDSHIISRLQNAEEAQRQIDEDLAAATQADQAEVKEPPLTHPRQEEQEEAARIFKKTRMAEAVAKAVDAEIIQPSKISAAQEEFIGPPPPPATLIHEPEAEPAVLRKNERGGELPPDQDTLVPPSEQPRKEKVGFLATALEKITGLSRPALEKISRSRQHLNERAKELDAKGEKLTGVEGWFRHLGENYNKLNFAYKLSLGMALGTGAVVSMAAFAPVWALGFAGALGVQRFYGMAGMFLTLEKSLKEKRIGESGQALAIKERAILDAALYTFAVSYAIKEGIEFAQKIEAVEHTRERLADWLAHMRGYDRAPEAVAAVGPNLADAATSEPKGGPTASTVSTDPAPAATGSSSPEGPKAGGEPSAGFIERAIPGIEVGAVAGRGYEDMAWRLWDQVKGLPDVKGPSGSDLERLLSADKSTVKDLVHELAKEHGFYKDGKSIQIINLGDRLSFDDDGMLVRTPADSVVPIPESAPAVPAAEGAPTVAPNEAAQAVHMSDVPSTFPDVRPIPPEGIPRVQGLSTEDWSGPSAEAVQPSYPVPEQVPPTPDSPPIPTVDVPQPEVQPSKPLTIGIEHERTIVQEVVNKWGHAVPLNEPHIYAGEGDRLLVFGGTPESQAEAIEKQFIAAPATTVVYGTSADGKYRIPFFKDPSGKITPGLPERNRGLLGFFSGWASAPGPDDLQKLIR